MLAKEFIQDLLSKKITEKGNWFLVDLLVNPNNQIKVVIDSFSGFSIDDCIEVTRYFEKNIDREVEDFELEVTSPGLGESFKVLQQYTKNLGKEIEIIKRDGQKVKGILKSAETNQIVVEIENMVRVIGKKKKQKISKEELFLLGDLKSVKLVLRF